MAANKPLKGAFWYHSNPKIISPGFSEQLVLKNHDEEGLVAIDSSGRKSRPIPDQIYNEIHVYTGGKCIYKILAGYVTKSDSGQPYEQDVFCAPLARARGEISAFFRTMKNKKRL